MGRGKVEDMGTTGGVSRRRMLGWMGAGAVTLAVQGGEGPVPAAAQGSLVAPKRKGERVRIAAGSRTVVIDAAATAVLVIDMQNDFVSPGGMLERLGADLTTIQRAVRPTAAVIAAARRAGMPIVYLKMAFRPDLSDVGPPDSPNWIAHTQAGVGRAMRAPDGREGRLLIRDTWNTEVIAALRPEPADVQLYKHRYSGFFETELDVVLRRLGVRYLMVTGCTTSVCVESTIRDAMFRDYSAILLADCTGEPLGAELPRSNHAASLFVIAERNFGWVSSSAAFLEGIRSRVPA